MSPPLPPPEKGAAWITGASSGIGRALALALAKEGWPVAASARSRAGLEDLSRAGGGRIAPCPLDVSDRAAVKDSLAAVERVAGPVHLAILGAGAYNPMNASSLDSAEFARQIEVNLTGLVNCLAELLPGMMNRGTGRIALLSSPSGYRGLPNNAAYGPAKAAVTNLAESLKFDLDRAGVDIRVVHPGFVRTPMTDKNNFRMPFLMEPDEAAARILSGLAGTRFEIAFPRRLIWPMKCLRLLPDRLYFPAIRRITGQ